MNINESKGSYIASKIGLKNGVIVNSGTIALLSALKLANIGCNDKVLINGYCCYSLYEAIKNVGAEPNILVPKNFYQLTDDEIIKPIKKNNIKCYIAAHQYGIVQNIKNIRETLPDLKIIEDIAQAWNVKVSGESIGKYSDYVVTSFGETKPLSYGQAGAVFSNNELHPYFDFHDKESRKSQNVLLPYALYMCDDIDEKKLVTCANDIVEKQRNIAKILTNYFIDNENVIIHQDNNLDESTFQRFPVIVSNPKYKNEIEKILNDNNILFQWQNDKEVWELDMVKRTDTKVIQTVEKPIYALIRTRQNNIDDVKKLVRRK